MKIKIKDLNICENCMNKTCSFIDAVVKENFYGIRSEMTVCPVEVLTDGPLLNNDKVNEYKGCVQCGLCILKCYQHNIEFNQLDDEKCDFNNLSEQQLNAIACSYLDKILGFCANTNRNKALYFDGYGYMKNGEELFVEVDWNNDSLECVRRLIGDFLTFTNGHIITKGIVVLQDLPKKGSREVFDLIQKIENFPNTNNLKILFTTFDALRKIYLNIDDNPNLDVNTLFCDFRVESHNGYTLKINQKFGGDLTI